MKGIIFSIEEFSVFDGPGIRTAVFFKGCPLRCMWCHNPEGFSFEKQLVKNPNSCISCGHCTNLLNRSEKCSISDDELYGCPENLIRMSGIEYEAEALANKLMKNADILRKLGGGVTLTGGEVLAQPEFLIELLDRLNGLHRVIETSGYGDTKVFSDAIAKCELVLMDIKLVDDEMHKKYTGVSNRIILENLDSLKASGVPFVIRVPLIPGITDTEENLLNTIRLATPSSNLIRFELLPFNKMAGAKYPMLSMTYDVTFDQNKTPDCHEEIFKKHSVPYSIL
jgi:pyruvate formate lyase activating enzyme